MRGLVRGLLQTAACHHHALATTAAVHIDDCVVHIASLLAPLLLEAAWDLGGSVLCALCNQDCKLFLPDNNPMLPPHRSMEDISAASYDDSGQLVRLDKPVALGARFCLPQQVALQLLQRNICTSVKPVVELMLSPELRQRDTPTPIQVYGSYLDEATKALNVSCGCTAPRMPCLLRCISSSWRVPRLQ